LPVRSRALPRSIPKRLITDIIKGARHEVSAGDLLLVEAGERHEIRIDGDAPLETVTVYAPPEY